MQCFIRSIAMNGLAFFLIATSFGVQLSAQDSPSAEPPKLRALIIDGQNNHIDWPRTTMMMRQFLEQSGRFTVDLDRCRYTWQGGDLLEEFPIDDGKEHEELPEPKADPNFAPKFSDYDVVVSNFGWNAAPWPEQTRKNLEAYMSGGGGLVIIHAADNSFGDWEEFNKMIGLGGWGGRNEKSGPYVYFNDKEQEIRDTTQGDGGSHGPQHEFQIVVREPDHPIVRGLPRSWMHTQDELYQQLRGPANNMTILATAFAAEDKKGTGRHEPMIMTIDYGKGRVFHTPMGHAGYSMECVGFETVFVRGCEWAATGEVTEDSVPDDFPTAAKISQRKFEWNKQPVAAK
jgi:uncharacterized protein